MKPPSARKYQPPPPPKRNAPAIQNNAQRNAVPNRFNPQSPQSPRGSNLKQVPQGQQQQPPQKQGKSAPQKAPTDPASNPLAQQIVDMGILIREPNVLWESIAGLADVKKLLRKNLVILPQRPDIAKGLLAPWRSVLLYGPPGTGKTFLAKAVATECKRTFFNITSASITSRWHGETEKLVAMLFDLADQMAPSTIFFDEIDAIASQRGGGHESDVNRRMKAQLLTKLEGVDSNLENNNVFILAATNFPWDLDEAIIRRFQKRIYIPLPDKEGRKTILEMQMGQYQGPDFQLDEWAEKLEGYSCADITNLCRDCVTSCLDKKMEMIDTVAFLHMPFEQARVLASNEDFARVVNLRKSSVDQSLIKVYEQWKNSKGAE